MKQILKPCLSDLQLECVLMQAWKKTSSYLRYHSWYSDTLEVDYQSLRIPDFINEIQQRIRNINKWAPKPLLYVPAPKNQNWELKNKKWSPCKNQKTLIRPLAHVDLQDQVIATAIMLCLADRVENLLEDPRLSIQQKANRKKILAYGHRLFCDTTEDAGLRHRWGSSKLYRQYFQDYRNFLSRPSVTVSQLEKYNDEEIAIVQSDLSKFYDRVQPELLSSKVMALKENTDDDFFFNLVKTLFNWKWSDEKDPLNYAKSNNIEGFKHIALPQGLVASGFFANIVLMDFIKAISKNIGKRIINDWIILEDACFYVDDMRLVLRIPKDKKEDDLENAVVEWLEKLLRIHAPGLKVSEDKTEITFEKSDSRFLIPQSKEANRIQKKASGVIDMLHGSELINTIEGFFHTQKSFSSKIRHQDNSLLTGVPDMRDDTAARFAAGKFRHTFRSLRPLLQEDSQTDSRKLDNEEFEDTTPDQLVLSKSQLDDRAKLFSALLIEEWVNNPGNIRLLRIALDIYPDKDVLIKILEIIRPAWEKNIKGNKVPIMLYCLGEIFRAGATETGMVNDEEYIPESLNIEDYRMTLQEEGLIILNQFINRRSSFRFRWYLMQQVFLYLISRDAIPEDIHKQSKKGGKRLSHYWELASALRGKVPAKIENRSIFYVLLRSAFGFKSKKVEYLIKKSKQSFESLFKISPRLGEEIWKKLRIDPNKDLKNYAQRNGLEKSHPLYSKKFSLENVAKNKENPFFEEQNLLELGKWLLSQDSLGSDLLTPNQIECEPKEKNGFPFRYIDPTKIKPISIPGKSRILFSPPDWLATIEAKQKYICGSILRFALRGSLDLFSSFETKRKTSIRKYCKPISNWEAQRYSGYQGRDSFGPSWIPISSFTEKLLFELLRWPGAGIQRHPVKKEELINKISNRLECVKALRGIVTSTTFLEQESPIPYKLKKDQTARKMRIGIVQSALPNIEDCIKVQSQNPNIKHFKEKSFHQRMRSHIAAILVGIGQMLQIRKSHLEPEPIDGYGLDLLIFPELAIHPNDIDALIIPFVRKHKCIVLFGQIYHKKTSTDTSLINSCLWIIPELDKNKCLRIKQIEQGKANLTSKERTTLNLEGFRPAQWLINYQWDKAKKSKPLVLSASVCYDATDLALAADLRDHSDLYIVCAYNKDVGTFDRMSEGLHYHMYQGVIIVNNGQYGGSCFYLPYKQSYKKQILHLHGQPQASIAFAEIDPAELLSRPKPYLTQDKKKNKNNTQVEWKTPPAGWKRNNKA